MQFVNSQRFAQDLDAQDPLKEFRGQFIIPAEDGKEHIYFLGNSLGLQPKNTAVYMQRVMDQWAAQGVEAFFRGDAPWLQYHDTLVQPLARIVGAGPHEVVVMNQLTVNLHLMLASFYRPAGKRNKILCEAKAFPSDQYMLETHVRQRGLDPQAAVVEVAPRPGEHTIRQEDILSAIRQHGDTLALVLWGGVNYYTGQVFNMAAITEAAQAGGAKVGFDLAHAAGNVPLQLHQWGVDFACWCNYKYLNSGPGAAGAAFIHERYHGDPSLQRLAGWWGYDKEKRFQMRQGFVPIPSAEGWQLSTPSPILYAAARASFELFDQAGMAALHRKGQQLSDFLLRIITDINAGCTQPVLQVLTPPEAKGCQLSLLVPEVGRQVFNHLAAAGIFADWREPDVIRVAPVPLYNTFEEVWQFGHQLQQAIARLKSST